jgi:hypothetical protein
MRRWGCLVAGLMTWACAHVEPKVRPGPPVKVGFAPPPGFAQLEIAKQERVSEIRFPDREPVRVREVIRTSQRETWAPLKGGGWRITAMQMDEDATRDGRPVASAVPLKGVAFVHDVDEAGRFLRAVDVPETVRDIEARVPTKELRKLLEPLLTPALVGSRMEAAWARRTRGLCGVELAPGAVFYGIDRQELPSGGPALSLVRARVVGPVDEGLVRAVELSLVFGGGAGELAREPGARDALLSLGKDERLVEEARGHGRRIVSLVDCQILAEEATLSGAWRLNVAALGGADPKGFPEQIRFEVRRAARRTSGPEARAAEPMP